MSASWNSLCDYALDELRAFVFTVIPSTLSEFEAEILIREDYDFSPYIVAALCHIHTHDEVVMGWRSLNDMLREKASSVMVNHERGPTRLARIKSEAARGVLPRYGVRYPKTSS